ncbi:MAG: biotin transporter BioY [Gemmatimonadales bacterium]
MDQAIVIGRSTLAIRAGAVALGALLVAAAAQVAVPLPGTPVPMTLQPLAVLLVGGLLGARLGALSMILYLAMGIAGLPVFTPTVPLVGVARLMGPTGGYLLAYPVAAFVVGRFSDPGRKPGENPNPASASFNPGLAPGVREPYWLRVGLGVLAGLVLIHLGGLAQLLIITGSVSVAARFGTLPFLLGDLFKLVIAVAILAKLAPSIRARL